MMPLVITEQERQLLLQMLDSNPVRGIEAMTLVLQLTAKIQAISPVEAADGDTG